MCNLSEKAAVIGLGNLLRRDDGIGILILEKLAESYPRQGVAYFNFGIASFDLVHRLQDFTCALLIDGIDAGLEPGKLRIFTQKEAVAECTPAVVSTHELNLKTIFELCETMHIPTVIHIAGIQVEDTSFGEALSMPLRNTFEKNVLAINDFINTSFLA